MPHAEKLAPTTTLRRALAGKKSRPRHLGVVTLIFPASNAIKSSVTMVVEVVYQRDSTLLSMFPHEEEGHIEDTSMEERVFDMERDTSHTNRNCGDDTRQSIHQNSILNCTGETEDEDDEIEEPGSFLFGDDDDEFHSPLNQSLCDDADVALVASSPASPPSQQKALCCVNDRWLDTSLQNVTDSFVSLCSSRPDEGACGVSDFAFKASETCSRQLQYQVELDLLHLLGCDSELNSHPGSLGQVAWFNTPLAIKAPAKGRPPVRRSDPRQRAQRIRRLRHELLGPETATVPMVSPTRSMDDGLDRWIGKGIDPIDPEDGYDSDPGEVLSSQEEPERNESWRETSLLDEEENDEEYHFYDGHRERIAEEFNMRMQYRGPRDEFDREVYEAVQVRCRVWRVLA